MLATNVRRLQNYGRFLSIHPVFHLLSSYGISASSLRCKNSKKNELVHGQTIAPPRGGRSKFGSEQKTYHKFFMLADVSNLIVKVL